MNVLVYSGTETSQSSVSSVITTFRSLLAPNYTVQAITHQALTSHPWSPTCALLILPDCRSIVSAAIIKSYVENGGALLAFSVGAKGSSENLSSGVSSLPVSDENCLRLRNPTTREHLLVESSDGSSDISLFGVECDGEKLEGVPCRYTRPSFLDLDNNKNVKVVGRFTDGSVAGISQSFGPGKAVLWAPLLEQPIPGDTEAKRLNVLRSSLRHCGLQVPEQDQRITPLPQFLVGQSHAISHILKELSAESFTQEAFIFKDQSDTFHFHPSTHCSELLQETRERDPATWQPKHILLYPDGSFPAKDQTPLFDIRLYFDELEKSGDNSNSGDTWRMGQVLLYGEVVTSTQTLLDKNPRLLSLLPTPLLSLASQQLQGRGRGANIWLSPAGCLQFSLLLKVSLASVPANKLVFVQYLFGLAVTEACRDKSVLGPLGEHVRLKWPNDIYVVVAEEKKKIGGVLVNMNFSSGKAEIVIGCGVNVLNPHPLTSLSQLIPSDQELNLRMERTAAIIMSKFEPMWNTFMAHRGSFEPFMDLYLRRWLHSNEIVTLTTTTPERKVRITGITSDFGLLRTVPVNSGWSSNKTEAFIDLLPDGNSFDIMAGLIKTKN